jgi:hypothetical protein
MGKHKLLLDDEQDEQPIKVNEAYARRFEVRIAAFRVLTWYQSTC